MLSLRMLEELQSLTGMEVRLCCVSSSINVLADGLFGVEYSQNYSEKLVISRARDVVVAMAPPLWSSISFSPALPEGKREIAVGMVRGCAIKVVSVFNRAFWQQKANEASGPAPVLENCGLIANLFPTVVAGRPALVGLITGATATEKYKLLSMRERQETVMKQISAFFRLHAEIKLAVQGGAPDLGASVEAGLGSAALEASDVRMLYFVDRVWCFGQNEVDSDEARKEARFNSGCFAAVMPPGLCTKHGDCIRDPIPHPVLASSCIHFASTELAETWPGYFEGAIESGYRAAADILKC